MTTRIYVFDDEPPPDHPCPAEVGERVKVVGMLDYRNHAGGTSLLHTDEWGAFVVVARRWWDYEIGWRFRGDLMGLDVGFSGDDIRGGGQ